MSRSASPTAMTVLLVGVAIGNALSAAVVLGAGDDPLSDWVSPWVLATLLVLCAFAAMRCLVLATRLAKRPGTMEARDEMREDRPGTP